MTLELSRLTRQVQAMGEEIAAHEQQYASLVELARQWLDQHADQGERLRQAIRAAKLHAAIPTGEPLTHVQPVPSIPECFTVIAADGSLIQPDRHGLALFYLLNVGSLVYRHGSGQAPEARSEPELGYTEDALYEDGLLVIGNLLDLRRDLAEITCLANLCEAEPPGAAGPDGSCQTVALVDGTLLLWVLEDRAEEWQRAKVMAYLDQVQRIRESGAAVAAVTSRPRRTEVTRLLHLASLDGDTDRAAQEPNPLERLPDRAVFETLAPGARSALFASPLPVNRNYYEPMGHGVHFFYLNLAAEGRESAIVRVELPAWVADDPDRLELIHGAIVAQAQIAGGYPYALARADELAFISGPERAALEEMIITELLRAGVNPTLSPKAYYKTLTRQGRKKHRI